MPLIHLAPRIAFAALAKAQRLAEEDLSGPDANVNLTETEIDLHMALLFWRKACVWLCSFVFFQLAGWMLYFA